MGIEIDTICKEITQEKTIAINDIRQEAEKEKDSMRSLVANAENIENELQRTIAETGEILQALALQPDFNQSPDYDPMVWPTRGFGNYNRFGGFGNYMGNNPNSFDPNVVDVNNL